MDTADAANIPVEPVPTDSNYQNPTGRRIPRSLQSICVALDELDQELDAEDIEDGVPTPQDPENSNNPSVASAKSTPLVSHPLDFYEQFPHIAIVTTASLPWLTGTAVNPALRAAYLQKRGHTVTLLVPWVVPAVQPRLFPEGLIFHTHEEQRQNVQEAIRRRVPFDVDFTKLSIVFYPGRYDSLMGSIMPSTDIQQFIPVPVDCVILEEPEHLTWYHTGKRWTRAFHPTPVVGIMHTNYVDYIRRTAGEATANLISRLNKYLCRMHTHKVIKLSDAVQTLPRQETCFVHGVSNGFLEVGERIGEAITHNRQSEVFIHGAYFLGKALWAKGFRELIDRLTEHLAWCEEHDIPPEVVDVYCKGENMNAIKREAERRELPSVFHGGRDHLDPEMQSYRCFINPSTSDVVATTSAEALAMGKWLVVPKHACNEFFADFKNCLIYDSPEEFSEQLHKALTHFPNPLTDEERASLSWECATDRLLYCCAQVEVEKGSPLGRVAAKTTWVGYSVMMGAMETVRKALTAGGKQGSLAQRSALRAAGSIPQVDSSASLNGGVSSAGGSRAASRVASYALLDDAMLQSAGHEDYEAVEEEEEEEVPEEEALELAFA